MRLITFLILLNISTRMFAQKDTVTLDKYSYLLVGFYDIKNDNGYQHFKSTQGTCFFVRQNKKLFLISAKHTLTSWNPENSQNRASYPIALNLRLFDTSGNASFYTINIKEINSAITGGYTYNDPDVYVLEFEDNPKYIIHSIEKFIDETLVIKPEDTIKLYGYPVDYDYFGEKQMKKLPTIKPTLVEGKPLAYDSPYRDSRIKKMETLNFAIQRIDTFPRSGCSGAPVFVKKEANWFFSGIFINSSPKVPVSLILRKDFVLAKLKEKLQ